MNTSICHVDRCAPLKAHRFKIAVEGGKILTTTRTETAALMFAESWAREAKVVVHVRDSELLDWVRVLPNGTHETVEGPRPNRVGTSIRQFESRLPAHAIQGIRHDVAAGLRQRDIAKKWGVSQGYVSKLAARKMEVQP